MRFTGCLSNGCSIPIMKNRVRCGRWIRSAFPSPPTAAVTGNATSARSQSMKDARSAPEPGIDPQGSGIAHQLDGFKGYISDVGGPTANMYGFECKKKLKSGVCVEKRCSIPKCAQPSDRDHHPQTELLNKLCQTPGVRKLLPSGIRYDMVVANPPTAGNT